VGFGGEVGGAALSPALAVLFLANPTLLGVPFFRAKGIKIAYDVLEAKLATGGGMSEISVRLI
jgi:hypothetical protein